MRVLDSRLLNMFNKHDLKILIFLCHCPFNILNFNSFIIDIALGFEVNMFYSIPFVIYLPYLSSVWRCVVKGVLFC